MSRLMRLTSTPLVLSLATKTYITIGHTRQSKEVPQEFHESEQNGYLRAT